MKNWKVNILTVKLFSVAAKDRVSSDRDTWQDWVNATISPFPDPHWVQDKVELHWLYIRQGNFMSL